MADHLKVKCEKCPREFWVDLQLTGRERCCAICGGDLTESMGGKSDYDWKRQLDNK